VKVLPVVFYIDCAWLAGVLVASFIVRGRSRAWLRLFAIYVAIETVGHYYAENGVAQLLGVLGW
jgi:hypothetical protein